MPKIIGDEVFASRLQSHPAGVYFFFGEEEFLKRRAAARLEALVTENEAFNVRRVDLSGGGDPLGALREEISAIPFLSEYRYTRIDHCAFWQLSGAQAEEFCKLLQSAPEDLILVFFYSAEKAPLSALSGSKKAPPEKGAGDKISASYVFQNLPENVCVVEFKHKSPEFLAGYLTKKCRARGVSIDPSVAKSCVTRCFLDLARIETVFEALCARAQSENGVITAQILNEYVEELPEEKVYLLTSALQEQRLNECIRLYEKLRASKIEPIVINAAINKTLSQLLCVKSGEDARKTQKVLGVSDYPFKLLNTHQRLWDEARLKEGIRLSMRVDTLMKNTTLDPDGLLTELMVRLCKKA